MNPFTLPRRSQPMKRRKAAPVRLELEFLEARTLLDGTPANILVNNPAEDTTSHDTQSETAIVLGANSSVVVAYNDTGAVTFPSFADLTGLGYSVSANAGASFTDEGGPPANPPYWAFFDPALARSSKTGTIFLSSTSIMTTQANGLVSGDRVNIFRSVDNGVSFSAPLSGAPGTAPGVDEADKPWVAVDNYPGPGYGNVYLTWTNINAVTQVHKAIEFTRSTDDGLTWGPSGGTPIASPGSNNAAAFELPFVTVGPDHTVYVFWWDANKGFDILMRKSNDQGQTFSDPVIVTGLKTHGNLGDLGLTDSSGRPFRTNTFPQAAINPVTGDIYVVYNDQGNGSADKADIFFTMSSDGGKHWSKPLRVNDDATNNDQWIPTIAVTPDGGHVGTFWYDRRLDPANNLIDRFGAIGTVSGHNVSFAPNFRITDVSFPPSFGQDSFISSDYMGDYDTATADNTYFFTTWGDNRLSDSFFANQPDVRFAKIPVANLEDPPGATTGGVTSSPAITAGVETTPNSLPAVLPGPSSFPTVFPSLWEPGAAITVGVNTTPSPSVSVQGPSSHDPAVPTDRPANPSARQKIPSWVLDAAFADLDNTFLPPDW
jgi:hypothetical protein